MIRLYGEELEQTTETVYLTGLITEDGQCTRDIEHRTGLVSAIFGTLSRR